MGNLDRFKEIVKIIKDNGILNGITPDKLYNTLEELGPSFIKIGQIMSTRVNLIPEEYCKKLSKLRSDVKPLEYKEIEKILKKEYKNIDKVFSHINKRPIGSASIAEVHKAKLKAGQEVVLKIKRPHVEEIFKTDMELLKKAINTLHLNSIIKVMDLNQVLDEIYETTLEETNFNIELEHLIKFKELNKEIDYVDCPNVYKELSNSNVIVMEYINGTSIDYVDDLESLGYDLENMAELLSKNYIKQALEDGFFHADPHPDNIFINDSKIVFLDLGMMGTLSDKNKTLLNKCVKSIVKSDYSEVGRILVGMSTRTSEVDYQKLIGDIRNILEEYKDMPLDNIDTKDFITKMFKMLRSNHLVLDKDVTMLIRGIGVIETVLKKLDPNTNLVNVLASTTNKEEIKNLFNKEKLKKISSKIIQNGESIVSIPNEASTFLKSLNRGETKFKFELSNSSKHVDKIETLVHELIIGFIDGCLILSISFIDSPNIKFIFLMFIILLSSWLLIEMIIDHNRKGY